MEPQRRRRRRRQLPPLVLLALLVAAVLAVFWRATASAVEMDLMGEAEVTLEYGSEYQDPGASALFRESLLLPGNQPVPVRMEGELNTDRVGDYTLRYVAEVTYRELFWQRTEVREITRVVHVVDTQAPKIVLNTQEGQYTLPGHEYEEEGFTAFDDHDGDLTDKVVRQVLEDTVIYTVTDASGNMAQATRPMYYYDPEVPTLELLGNRTMTVMQGEAFDDPGCVAMDNCDGDISDRVTVTGNLDIQTPGAYTLTYTVSDTWGNSAAITRIVIVREPDSPINKGKIIYLTFDDGPGKHTSRLLEILEKYDVKATFFVMDTGYLHLLPDIAAGGHTIAMHTDTHQFAEVYSSDDAFFRDLYAIQNKIYEQTGRKPMLLRFPGGSSNTISQHYSPGIMTRLTQKVTQMGYRYFDWNVDSNDAGGASTADEVFRNVVRGVAGKDYAVVLQHDVKGFSVDAVERIIQWGLSNGYTFAALEQDSPECEHPIYN